MEITEYVQMRKEFLRAAIAAMAVKPVLSIITVGYNAASEAYVRGKTKDSAEVGFESMITALPEETSEAELLDVIAKQNADPSITGILVQLPVPPQIHESAIIAAIDPAKDVDGFSPVSPFDPCTPKGIMDYLRHEGFDFEGANAVVLGRSNIVGKPMAKLLLQQNANVTVLHSRTKAEDRAFYLKHADLIVVAIGKCGYLDDSYDLKETAWVVDVGINRGEDGKLHGDCVPGLKVARQTPVPKGVGLLTRLALLDNLLLAANRK